MNKVILSKKAKNTLFFLAYNLFDSFKFIRLNPRGPTLICRKTKFGKKYKYHVSELGLKLFPYLLSMKAINNSSYNSYYLEEVLREINKDELTYKERIEKMIYYYRKLYLIVEGAKLAKEEADKIKANLVPDIDDNVIYLKEKEDNVIKLNSHNYMLVEKNIAQKKQGKVILHDFTKKVAKAAVVMLILLNFTFFRGFTNNLLIDHIIDQKIYNYTGPPPLNFSTLNRTLIQRWRI